MPSAPRIAFITVNAAAPWGGSEELWSAAADRLLQAGSPVLILRRKWSPTPPALARLVAAGAQWVEIPENFHSAWSQRLRRAAGRPFQPVEDHLVRRLVSFRPDLVVISQGHHYDGLAWMSACARHGLRFASLAQSAAEYYWPSPGEVRDLREAYGAAAATFFVSEHNRRLASVQIAADIPRAERAYNPVKVPFVQDPVWPAPAEPLRLACVARLEPNCKGQDVLFQVLALPRWRARPLRLTCFGGGRNAETLRELAAYFRLESVDFGNHVDDVTTIWRDHHALILASRFEGLPLALLEAMLCHRPAIVTDVGGCAEVTIDGETGFVASAPTVSDVDRALERAWNARAAWPEMGRRAGARVRTLIPAEPVQAFTERLRELAGR